MSYSCQICWYDKIILGKMLFPRVQSYIAYVIFNILFVFLWSHISCTATDAEILWTGKETVSEYAKRLNIEPTLTVNLAEGCCMEFVLIPAGKYVMGATVATSELTDWGPKTEIIAGQTLIIACICISIILISGYWIRVKYYKGMRISLWRIYIVFLLLAIAEGGGVMWYDAYKRMSEYSSVWNEEDSFEGFFWGDEYPPHEVTISLPYYLGKYEVTQSQYEVIMGDNPSQWRNINKPVEMIPWNMAKEFCRRMTDRIGRECRLPSEAEWEYACRAGKNKQLCIAKPRNIKSAIGWYADNSEGMTHSVGQKAPNGFGLYDMLGNVSEWCEDVRHKSYVGAPSDGRAWVGNDTDAHRICRGGSYDSSIQCCRATDRSSGFANYGMSVIGFRVLISIFQETETFTR